MKVQRINYDGNWEIETVNSNQYQPPKPVFVPVTWQNGKLAFKFDPLRGLIELQERGVKQVFDLSVLAENAVSKTNEIITDSV